MPILVTGGAGFIGSACTAALLRAGREVVLVDSLDDFLYSRQLKERNLDWLRSMKPLRFLEVDIRDRQGLERAFGEHEIESVLHLAAIAGVRPSLEMPQRYFDVNVTGTANILDVARSAGVRRFVLASSSSVYGRRASSPFSETDPADAPLSPYAASKRGMELLAASYHAAFSLDIACMRYFTVYGPRQRPDMAFHRFFKKGAAGEPVHIFGDGDSSRDYTFIDDVVDGTLAALDRSRGYRLFNIGRTETHRLASVVDLIGRLIGSRLEIERLPDQPGDVPLTCADITRASAELGYRPKVPLEEGLQHMWRWFCRETRL